MLRLFEPQIKVQKNRQVVRQTDTRMAKYSRRGLISHLLIYLLCLLFSQDFYTQHRTLVVVLTIGLLITISVRGYLLFRFSALYPRAPAAWRSKYFAATLVGAGWWGVVVASFTLFNNMQGVAPLLWLYTVVFFATTAHAFAPYQRFLSVYQFLGLIPAALCTFFTGEFLSVLYGGILLIFYRILNHHCELMASSYWERMEADHTLALKTESIEEEKRDTRASVALSKEFMTSLHYEMQLWSLKPEVTGHLPIAQRTELVQLEQCVEDFRKILCKELNAEPRTFNVRRYLQSIAAELVEAAERKGLELETALSLTLPARVIGDAPILGQIVRTLIASSIKQTDEGLLLVEVEFTREYEDAGHLQITLIRQYGALKRGVLQSRSMPALQMNIDLIVARGLAESLNGMLDIAEMETRDGKTLRLTLPMGVAAANPKLDYKRPSFRGKPLLLIHPWSRRWLDAKRLELEVLGFAVTTTNDYKKAQQVLQNAVEQGSPFGCVVYSALWGDDSAWQFANDLFAHGQLKYTHHFVICSGIGRRYFREKLSKETPLLHTVLRPSGMFEFELTADAVFDEREQLEADATSGNRSVNKSVLWIALGKNADSVKRVDSDGMPGNRVSDLKQLEKRLSDSAFDLIVVEHTGEDVFECIRSIRAFEAGKGGDYYIPVVGIGPAAIKKDMMEYGVDHFVGTEDLVAGDTSYLRYWLH